MKQSIRHRLRRKHCEYSYIITVLLPYVLVMLQEEHTISPGTGTVYFVPGILQFTKIIELSGGGGDDDRRGDGDRLLRVSKQTCMLMLLLLLLVVVRTKVGVAVVDDDVSYCKSYEWRSFAPLFLISAGRRQKLPVFLCIAYVCMSAFVIDCVYKESGSVITT